MYVWQRWLADEFRAAGLKVVEVQGWKNRGRPAATGSFNPDGQQTKHHTGAFSSEKNPHPTLKTLIQGRSDLPGPLCHWTTGADGTIYVIAAGRANHAGRVGKRGVPGMPYGADGNALALGDEIDTNGTQPLPKAQRDAAALASAVVMRHFRKEAAYVHRHKDISGTGKWDIGNISTEDLRKDAQKAARELNTNGDSEMDEEDFKRVRKIVDEGFERFLKRKLELRDGRKVTIENALKAAASTPNIVREENRK